MLVSFFVIVSPKRYICEDFSLHFKDGYLLFFYVRVKQRIVLKYSGKLVVSIKTFTPYRINYYGTLGPRKFNGNLYAVRGYKCVQTDSTSLRAMSTELLFIIQQQQCARDDSSAVLCPLQQKPASCNNSDKSSGTA